MGLLAAMGAALAWGLADFLGGREARRMSAIAVAFWGRAAALLPLVVLAAVLGRLPNQDELPWALAAGVLGPLALIALYRALSGGAMSLTAPLIAAGATSLPVLAGLAAGDRPARVQLVGMLLAAVGVTLVSAADRTSRAAPAEAKLAATAAVLIGLTFVAFQQAGDAPGDAPVGIILVATIVNLAVLAAVAAVRRPSLAVPAPVRVAVVAIGLCDVLANVLYTYASGAGNAVIVASVGATFPVVTAVFAVVLLGERLTRRRLLGVAAVAIALPVIAAG